MSSLYPFVLMDGCTSCVDGTLPDLQIELVFAPTCCRDLFYWMVRGACRPLPFSTSREADSTETTVREGEQKQQKWHRKVAI